METKETKTEETKTEETKTEETKTNARVELHIPRGAANDEPNVVIGINGKLYVLPKGKTSKVPPEVKAEYDRAVKAQDVLDDRRNELLKASSGTIESHLK